MKHHTKLALGLIAATAIVGAASVPVLAHGSNWKDGAMDADQGYRMMQGEGEGPGGMGEHDGPGGMGEQGMMRTMMSMQGGMMGSMGGNGPMGALLGNFDANGDGTVTPQEVRDGMTALLKKYDADGSGSLSLGEFETLHSAAIRERMVDRFQALDNDGDGQVTPDEMTAPADRMRATHDAMQGGAPQQMPDNGGMMNGNGMQKDDN